MKINYIIGDATNPVQNEKGMKFIAHCCNNIGAWGSGFVIALSKRWGTPELIYRKWVEETSDNLEERLGRIQVIPVEKDIMVANIIGQNGIGIKNGIPPIRYEAIKKGLDKLQEVMVEYENKNPSLHLPRIGAGLAGGDWKKIEEIIESSITFPTTVYTLASEVHKFSEE